MATKISIRSRNYDDFKEIRDFEANE